MQTIKLKTYVSNDGLLNLKLPVEVQDQQLEVIIIYQPIISTTKRSWSPGFLERTFGCWQGELLVRAPQGELPEREPLL